ncbi:hypothetical protein [Actinoplanes sp. NPDC026619]|uniref:hypothetical protein n=1 Tax=Actinoplanes sp. NPDC026619 TaxID=3155798 RepID=UPI0033D553EC
MGTRTPPFDSASAGPDMIVIAASAATKRAAVSLIGLTIGVLLSAYCPAGK